MMTMMTAWVTFLSVAAVAAPAPSATEKAPAPDGKSAGLRILFIGNSYTYGNDLPKMLAELAEAGGQPRIRHERETPGGCTLEKHLADGKAPEKIKSGKWDWVVLQEQSTRCHADPARMAADAAKLDREIRAAGGKTILYMTWAPSAKPEIQKAITESYLKAGKDIGAVVAPAGRAWEKALAAEPKPVLHAADGRHPSRTGTYLTACVFYAVLYGKSPVGLPGKPGGLGDEEAKKLQAVAWSVVGELRQGK